MGLLRIIAGELRGRRIEVPRGAVRPTGDRVREALFDILGPAVQGAAVLDAYSGTGALGFESLSRGATHVVMIEADRRVARALSANVARFGLEKRVEVIHGTVVETLGGPRAAGPFDLILADPPYDSAEIERFLPAIAGRLAPGGQVVVERDSKGGPPDPSGSGLVRVRTARYGRASLDFYLLEAGAGVG